MQSGLVPSLGSMVDCDDNALIESRWDGMRSLPGCHANHTIKAGNLSVEHRLLGYVDCQGGCCFWHLTDLPWIVLFEVFDIAG